MWNDIDYDFVALDLPNLGWAKSKTDPPNVPVSFCATLAPLAHAAAKKFPNWTFVGCEAFRGGSNHMYIGALNVYEGRESLGTLGFVMHPAIKFVINNKRIKKTRQRGEGAKTGDVKKALRLMTKMFKVQTFEEKSMEAYRRLSDVLGSSHCGIVQRRYVTALDVCLNTLGAYLLNNFEVVSAAAIAAGAPAGVVNSIPSLKEDLDTVSTVHNAFAGGRGQYFMLDGSDYIMRQRAGDVVLGLKTYSSDTLPAAIKLKIGLLKLLEDNHYMKDVGYRLDAANFYVLVDPD